MVEPFVTLNNAPSGIIRTGIRTTPGHANTPLGKERSKVMTDWKKLKEEEALAYFKAELVDISPESYTLEFHVILIQHRR